MFVNSCLCIVGTFNIDLGVMDWKSTWPTCHGTVNSVVMVQWFCSISETQIDIWTSYLQILKWYDTIIHLNIAWPTCHGSVISVFMVQWFCPISESPFDIWTSYLQTMKCYDTVFDLNINIGHYGLYFMVQWFCFISERSFDICTLIFPDYEMVWHNLWPQYDCKSLWPIFHGPVILLEVKI